MATEYRNNTQQFLNQFSAKRLEAHFSMAEIGLDGINSETPVKTGNLKSKNVAEGRPDAAYWYNDTPYAPYVHYGTYKMTARPFIVQGVLKKASEIIRTIVRILKV